MPNLLPFSHYEAALQALNKGVIKLGLERMQRLCKLLGHPQAGLPCVQVAGTNGKGSVCAMLSQGLAAQGFKVGLTISPHLQDVRERIQLNNALLPPDAFHAAVDKLWRRLTQELGPFQTASGQPNEEWPTYFEFLILLAFRIFAKEQVDIVILETGLGGEWDATNVVAESLCSVISSISLDHQDRLGDSLTAIASAKAGIFKPQGRVVLGPNLPDEARNVLLQKAVEQESETVLEADASILFVKQPFTLRGTQLLKNMVSQEVIELSLLGDYQRENVATVLATLNVLQRAGFLRDKALFYKGLSEVRWPGRLQVLPLPNAKSPIPVVVDGSHNEAGFQSLKVALPPLVAGRPLYWLLSLRANRPMEALLPLLRHYATSTRGVWVSRPASQEASLYHSPTALRAFLRQQLPELETRFIWASESLEEGVTALSASLQSHQHLETPTSTHGAMGICTGSLYSVGELLARFAPEPPC